jgi:hypothetical protein
MIRIRPAAIDVAGRMSAIAIIAGVPLGVLLGEGFAWRATWFLWPGGYSEAALNGWAGQASLQPGWNLLQAVIVDELARAIEADEVPHPPEHRNVSDGIDVSHDPVVAGQPRLEHAQQTL